MQDASTTLSPTRDVVAAFDLEGRPTSLFMGGDTFKRSLASEVFGRRSVGGARHRWRLPQDRARDVLERALVVGHEAAQRQDSVTTSGHRHALAQRLSSITAWTGEALQAEGARFARAYAPVSILPPDQYGSIVLQATFGCSWNRCTYCTFYQGRPFQVRHPQAFEEHVDAVQRLLGRAAFGRESVFLADGNALVLSNERLRPLFEVARATFPGRRLAGFVDVFGGERKPVEDWRELRMLGLDRVAVGIETGHDPLLAYLNKPGSATESAEFVAQLKRAGLHVSVILMVGVGGRRYAEGHQRDTASLLERLPLDARDIVYLSPFVRHTDSEYARSAEADGLEDLSEVEREAQDGELRRAARAAAPKARVTRYHIDEFVY